jgi:hypothetical protein
VNVDPTELIQAEASFLEAQAEALRKRAGELRGLLRDGQDAELVAQLEALPWIPAKSGRCDYTKDAPPQLVEAVRGTRGGVRGDAHHFTAAADSLTLFRFPRRKEAKSA